MRFLFAIATRCPGVLVDSACRCPYFQVILPPGKPARDIVDGALQVGLAIFISRMVEALVKWRRTAETHPVVPEKERPDRERERERKHEDHNYEKVRVFRKVLLIASLFLVAMHLLLELFLLSLRGA